VELRKVGTWAKVAVNGDSRKKREGHMKREVRVDPHSEDQRAMAGVAQKGESESNGLEALWKGKNSSLIELEWE